MRWLDLFSGIGGFALGLRWAGFPPPVAFCEPELFCQRVLRKHWPDVPVFDDVRELDADAVRPVELVTGGFPCQPWSVAGQRGGADDDRDLWPEMRRVVAAARPRWVLGENVPGLVGEPLGLDRVLADLEALGYASQAFCIPACAVDAPHIRDRVWIVGYAAGSGEPPRREGWVAGTCCEAPRGGQATQHRGTSVRHVAHALGSGLEVGAGERRDDGAEREAAERGGGLGDADDQRQTQPRGPHRKVGRRAGDAGDRSLGDADLASQDAHAAPSRSRRATGESNAWSNAEWLHCAFDGKARRVEPGVRLLASGVPERVARLRALGNSVVPQIVEQLGRAILQTEAA